MEETVRNIWLVIFPVAGSRDVGFLIPFLKLIGYYGVFEKLLITNYHYHVCHAV